MPDLSAFQFLRPAWLWAFAPLVVVAIALARQGDALARWRRIVEPHLLEHLVVRPRRRWGPRPRHLLVVALALAILALAGPSWRHETSPFADDVAPLVVVVDLSDSMRATDVSPSRIERAKQKVRDLLELRPKAPTALVVYAGTAHRVLPLTDDADFVESFATALDPAVMPVAGKEPEAALAVAQRALARGAAPGTILFLTDGIPAAAAPAFAAAGDGAQLVVLAVGTDAGGTVPGGQGLVTLDRVGLETLSREAGVEVVGVTFDGEDVRRVVGAIDSHFAAAQADDDLGRPRDEGWWLTLPVTLVALAWFRRGWLVRWES